jgi:hypothetical protein
MLRAVRNLSTAALLIIILVVVGGLVFLFVPLSLSTATSSRGELLAPLIAAAALLVSGFALTVSVRTQQSGFRAEEKVKEDIGVLLAALRNIRDWLGLAETVVGNTHMTLIDESRAAIRGVLLSTTGNALQMWESKKSQEAGKLPSEWRVLSIYFLEILELPDPERVSSRARSTYELFRGLSSNDVHTIAGYVSDLTRSSSLLRSSYGVIDNVMSSRAVIETAATPDRLSQFRALQAAGVDDPDVDMFVAVLTGDEKVDALRDALERGADPNATDTQVLARYRDWHDSVSAAVPLQHISAGNKDLLKFRALQAAEVDDPDVDMFVAVLSGGEKADALRDALERGADPKVTDTQVLARYRDLFLKWLSRLEALAVSDVVDPNLDNSSGL